MNVIQNPARALRLLSSRRGVTIFVLVMAVFVSACEKDPQDPPEPPEPTVIPGVPVALEDLPEEAAIESIGSIGTAFRLEGEAPIAGSFEVPGKAIDGLLPATVRLFHFRENEGQWAEVPDSAYDEKARELTGKGLSPGLYTAFGWSKNPVESTIQRLIFDGQRGYRPEAGELQSLEKLRLEVQQADFELQPGLVRDWLELSVTLPRRTCETIASEDCDFVCQRMAGRIKLSSCPEECPAPDCCSCQDFSWTDRVRIPGGILPPLPEPCAGGPNGPFCPICPLGLSCPTGEGPGIEAIAPILEVPDYTVLDDVGLREVIEDVELRDVLHRVVEETVGTEYPVPPPYPAMPSFE